MGIGHFPPLFTVIEKIIKLPHPPGGFKPFPVSCHFRPAEAFASPAGTKNGRPRFRRRTRNRLDFPHPFFYDPRTPFR
jgi:hypothetical protein